MGAGCVGWLCGSGGGYVFMGVVGCMGYVL